jgi:hypothetical protein
MVNLALVGLWQGGGMHGHPTDTGDTTLRPRSWWETGWLATALVLVTAVPLLWPALPPLGDLPGHMGRWHIATALPSSPYLARYYAFDWSLIPNLGMDLLVPALARVFGLEPAAKVAVIAIPMLTATGLSWAAREAHGRLPPTAIFVLPLTYAWPFQFGFVNFALSQALAFCALAGWIRLGRQRRLAVRAVLFGPIGAMLSATHSFGWGMFGLMAAGADLARQREAGRGWGDAVPGVVLQCLPLTLPIAAMIMVKQPGAELAIDGWFALPAKTVYLLSILRDRWEWFDVGSLLAPAMLLYGAARSPRLGFTPLLGWPALLCLVAFLALPQRMMGGAYVDMRMAPAALMLALIAVAPVAEARFGRALALAGLLFCALRLGGTTLSFVLRSGEQQSELRAIAAMPRGAAILSLVARPCNNGWSEQRRDQLPGMAIVRRDVFTNSQWALAGQQLLRIRYVEAEPYARDPSQSVYAMHCATTPSGFNRAIARFPRTAFTHVWTLGFPPGVAQASDLRVVWTNGTSTLYRVVR